MNIVQEIREEIKGAFVEPSSRDLTKLAALYLIVPGLIGSYLLFWKGASSGRWWIFAGVALSLTRLAPPLFRLIYRLWISLAVILGYFVSRILLTMIFFLVILPTGLIMRLFGKDPMDRKLDPDAPTYWIKREDPTDAGVKRYEKQF
ncbi:MAG: SxtJ family membrane protein [Desulfomonile sp.]|nr:SxtJ family membrane protein [Desulfomonile sp.]